MKKISFGNKLPYKEWVQYVLDSREYSKLKNKIPKAINNLRKALQECDDKFLGKHNLFMDIKYIKRKTEEIYKRSQEIINK